MKASVSARSARRVATRVFLAAAVALLVAACSRPQAAPANPILPQVPREAFLGTWNDGKVVLLGIGDSITDGYGAREGRGYFDMLARNPEGDADEMQGVCLTAVFPKLKSHNLALSASTSAEHLVVQVERMPKFGDDVFGVVVVTTGGNDVIHNYGAKPPEDGAMYGATIDEARPWIAALEKRINAILDGIDASFPGGCEIFLANIYDPTDGVGDIENAGLGLPRWKDGLAVLEAANDLLARSAGERANVHLVDIRTAFLGHGIHCSDRRSAYYHAQDPSYWYFENLEDPNETGYDAIRRLFLIEMAKVFENALAGVPPTHPTDTETSPAH